MSGSGAREVVVLLAEEEGVDDEVDDEVDEFLRRIRVPGLAGSLGGLVTGSVVVVGNNVARARTELALLVPDIVGDSAFGEREDCFFCCRFFFWLSATNVA
jgi:hypothetical protein